MGKNNGRKDWKTMNTWAGIYEEDWRWLGEMTDLHSGLMGMDAVGEDYKAVARGREQHTQWKPHTHFPADWYYRSYQGYRWTVVDNGKLLR